MKFPIVAALVLKFGFSFWLRLCGTGHRWSFFVTESFEEPGIAWRSEAEKSCSPRVNLRARGLALA